MSMCQTVTEAEQVDGATHVLTLYFNLETPKLKGQSRTQEDMPADVYM